MKNKYKCLICCICNAKGKWDDEHELETKTMKHRNRASQFNAIEATDSKGQIERWERYKAESGIWVLRDEAGIEIEFDTTMHKSKPAMKRCLQNRGLRAEI